MRAGSLKTPITIKTPVITTNEFNEQVATYETKTTTRAHVVSESGNRTDENNETVYPKTLIMEVRYYVDVDDFDYIYTRDGTEYRIISIEGEDSNNKHAAMKRIRVEKTNSTNNKSIS